MIKLGCGFNVAESFAKGKRAFKALNHCTHTHANSKRNCKWKCNRFRDIFRRSVFRSIFELETNNIAEACPTSVSVHHVFFLVLQFILFTFCVLKKRKGFGKFFLTWWYFIPLWIARVRVNWCGFHVVLVSARGKITCKQLEMKILTFICFWRANLLWSSQFCFCKLFFSPPSSSSFLLMIHEICVFATVYFVNTFAFDQFIQFMFSCFQTPGVSIKMRVLTLPFDWIYSMNYLNKMQTALFPSDLVYKIDI